MASTAGRAARTSATLGTHRYFRARWCAELNDGALVVCNVTVTMSRTDAVGLLRTRRIAAYMLPRRLQDGHFVVSYAAPPCASRAKRVESNGLPAEARVDRDSPPSLAVRATAGTLRLDGERRMVEAPGFGRVEHTQGQSLTVKHLVSIPLIPSNRSDTSDSSPAIKGPVLSWRARQKNVCESRRDANRRAR